MYRVVIFLTILVLLAGCSFSSIKAPYPVVTLYKLDQLDTTASTGNEQIDFSLQIRSFGVNSIYDTDHLLAESGPAQMTRYYYHRWAAGISMMMTDFLIERYGRKEIFKKGVLSQVSSVAPDFILEGQVLKAAGINNLNDTTGNSAELSLKIELLDYSGPQKKVLLSKVYSKIQPRPSSDAASIASALSSAASFIADEILKDILSAIRKETLASPITE